MKNSKIVFGALLLFALTLRCLFISTRGIQYDDAFSILLAQRSLPEIIRGTAADTMPPLYYFLLHFWMFVSTEIWWYRLLSVVLSMGSLVFLYLIVKKLTGTTAAAWALFFGAVSSFQIYHAQDIRMYALLQFFQAAYIYFFILLIKNENQKVSTWAGLILAGTGAFYTHNLGAFFLLAPNIYLLIQRKWKLQSRLIASQTGMFILFLPWAIFFLDSWIRSKTPSGHRDQG
jgi:mannosyltransferase